MLFETFEGGMATGHTPDFLEVSVKVSDSLHGQILPVRLISHDGTVCSGELINTAGGNV